MLTEKFHDVLKNEGVVAIVSWGMDEPHVICSWNSYLVVTSDERILIPAALMHKTEKNVIHNSKIKLALGSRNVTGYKDYKGTGFVIEGDAKFLTAGPDYNMMKEKYPFLTRVLEISVKSATQKI